MATPPRAKEANILVTGGTGLLGCAMRKVVPDARFIASKDCDLRDRCAVERLFAALRPEKVVHLAAVVGGVKKNASHNAELFADNVLINANVLDIAHKNGVKDLVSMLSSCSYPVYPDRPSTEEDLHNGLPFRGNSGYAASKRMLHLQSTLLWEQYGCRYSTLTPATLYGPHDNWDLESGHVIASLIHKCFLAKRAGKPLEVWGSGDAVRQFMFVEDAARIIVDVLKSAGEPEHSIVVPNQGITIRALAESVAAAMGFKGEINFDASKPEGQRIRVLQSIRFDKRRPGQAFTPLQEGLKATAEWFLANESSRALASARMV